MKASGMKLFWSKGHLVDRDVIGHVNGTMLSRSGVPRVKEIFEGLSEFHGDIRNVKSVSEEAADAFIHVLYYIN